MKESKFIGTKTHAFTVIELVRCIMKPSNKEIAKYKVKCNKCGNIEIKSKFQIISFKSDGCMKCSTVKHKIKYSINERNYKNYKSKIDRHQRRSPKQIKFNLSFEEFDKLTRLDCYYCGVKPSFLKRFKNDFKNREIEYFNGIDRIDSDKDYNLNNCVPCCTMCNRMKSDYNVSIFFKTHRTNI